jgi:hypothetical protein
MLYISSCTSFLLMHVFPMLYILFQKVEDGKERGTEPEFSPDVKVRNYFVKFH